MNGLKRLRREMADKGLDGLLLMAGCNRLYATGFASSAGEVVVTRDECLFVTDFRYYEAACRLSGLLVRQTGGGKNYETIVNEFLEDHGVKRLGFEEERTTVSLWRRKKEKLHAELVPADGAIRRARMAKEPHELAALRKAQRIAEEALDAVLPSIREGVAEREIAAELLYQMLKRGATGPSFDPIVVSGKNGALPHGVPGDKTFVPGEFITMDFGCIADGYCSDMTRTVALGYADEEMKKVYGVVLAAQRAGIAAARAGVTGEEVDAAARDVIAAAGYGAYFGHSFGHGVGVEIHESPNAAPGQKEPMPAGSVISAEPGIYLPGKLGVRIEDVLVLEENGAANLTNVPKELLVVG